MATSFLQGLFLEEQLRAARENQRAQINANQQMQTASQDFAREQGMVQQNQFMDQLAMQKRQMDLAERAQQFGRQATMAELIGKDIVRPAAAPTGMAFDPAKLPQMRQQPVMPFTELADPVEPGPWRQEMPPAFTPQPLEFTAPTATPTPAPEGSLVNLDGQQFVIPSQAQRTQETIANQAALADAQVQQRLKTATELVDGIPDLAQEDRAELLSQVLVGTKPERFSYAQLASRYMQKYLGAVRANSPEAPRYYQAAMTAHKMALELAGTSAFARFQNPTTQLDLQARSLAGQVYQKATEIVRSVLGDKATARDVQNQVRAMMTNPEQLKNISPELLTAMELHLQNLTSNPTIQPSISDKVAAMTGQPAPDPNAVGEVTPPGRSVIGTILENRRNR